MPAVARIPRHITALYVFAVVNMTLMCNISLVEASILVLDKSNSTIDEMRDEPARFGPTFPDDGLWGHVIQTVPRNACSTVAWAPPSGDDGLIWVALVRRYDCNFDMKVLNAQNAGFGAVLVHNVDSDKLLPMGSSNVSGLVTIPSAFVGDSDSKDIVQWETKYKFLIVIDGNSPFDANLYLVPFAIVVGICFILMLVFMIGKWIMDCRKIQKSRLSRTNLNKIPVKKFKKGDKYDVCAICLDEYETGEKLRVLPCGHTYHTKCVDPWLTKNKKTCPICKQKVIPGEDSDDSDSDVDSDDDSAPRETTPLLTAQNAGAFGRIAAAFENSGLPSAVRSDVRVVPNSDDTDSGSSTELARGATPSTYQSQADVHHSAPRQQSGAASSNARPGRGYGSMRNNHPGGPGGGATRDDDNGEVQGAVGGVSVNCDGTDADKVDFVEDHYSVQNELHPLVGGQPSSSDEDANASLLVRMFRKSKRRKNRNDSDPEA